MIKDLKALVALGFLKYKKGNGRDTHSNEIIK